MFRSTTLPLRVCSTLVALSAARSSGGAAPANRAATQAAAAPDNAQQSNGYVDPCAVLTRADVEAVISEPAAEGKLARGGAPLGQVICTYGVAAATVIKGVQLSVVRTQSMSDRMHKQGYSARKLYEDGKVACPNHQAVFGIGDNAYQTGHQIQAVQGDTQFTVGFTIGSGATGMDDATLIALAKKLSAKLPR